MLLQQPTVPHSCPAALPTCRKPDVAQRKGDSGLALPPAECPAPKPGCLSQPGEGASKLRGVPPGKRSRQEIPRRVRCQGGVSEGETEKCSEEMGLLGKCLVSAAILGPQCRRIAGRLHFWEPAGTPSPRSRAGMKSEPQPLRSTASARGYLRSGRLQAKESACSSASGSAELQHSGQHRTDRPTCSEPEG